MCVLIQSHTDDNGVYSETQQNFSRTDLDKFKVQFDLLLKLDLPIKLPAVELHTKTAFDFCQLVSAFQKILKAGLSAATKIGDTGSQLTSSSPPSSSGSGPSSSSIKPLSSLPSLPSVLSSPVSVSTGVSHGSGPPSIPTSTAGGSNLAGGILGSMKSHASDLESHASDLANSAKNVANKAFSSMTQIANLVDFVLQKPVDVFVEVLVFLLQGMKTCDEMSASFSAQGGINPLQQPLLLSMSVPPSPAKPVLTLTVKDTYSVCAMAGALRAAGGEIKKQLDDDAAEDGENTPLKSQPNKSLF